VRPRGSRASDGTTTAVVPSPAPQGVNGWGTNAHSGITRTTTRCGP
jgi:hypothetical protein